MKSIPNNSFDQEIIKKLCTVKRKIEYHAEYVVAAMVLEEKVPGDILKYLLKSYIEE
jgi:hypothetical protein